MSIFQKTRQLGEMLKISHTVFALPFALAALLAGSEGMPELRLLILLILAMFTMRNAGMSFNRLVDAEIDAKNPRTSNRHLPQHIFSKKFVWLFCLLNTAAFLTIVFFINPLCFLLSPLAILIVFSYSFMKRFTALSHLVLGIALGISPIGAWLAVRGSLEIAPFLLGAAVLFWVAGFDLIYATQDYEFDKKEGLHSLVVSLGLSRALFLSRLFHIITLALLFLFGRSLHFKLSYWITLSLIALLFIYEHSLISAKDLSRVNAAFFNINGFISLLFLIGVAVSIFTY